MADDMSKSPVPGGSGNTDPDLTEAAQGGALLNAPTPPAPAAPTLAPQGDQSGNQNQASDQSQQAPNQKQNQPTAPTATPAPRPTDPGVHRASVIRSIAETLAGGQRYQVQTDVNTGEIKRVPVPMSGRHIGMAIALEAIAGGLSGLQAGRGRGAGAAGVAGFERGQDIQQQRDAQQDQEMTRQASIARTNMSLMQTQRYLADADRESHQKNVDTYASTVDEARSAGAIDQEDIGEDELNKLLADGTRHITKDMVLPTRVVEKMGADGKPVKGPHGAPVWEERFAIVKPASKIGITSDLLKFLQDNKVTGYVDKDGNPLPLPDNIQARLHLVAHAKEEANKVHYTDQEFFGYGNNQAHGLHKDTAITPTTKLATNLGDLFNEGGNVDYDKLSSAFIQHESPKAQNIGNRNNNPGNLKDGKFTKGLPGYTGQGEGGYAHFDTKEHGQQALISMLQRDMPKYGSKPVDQYIRNVYSNGDSENVINGYANDLMKIAGKAPNVQQQASDEVQPGMSQADITKLTAGLTSQDRQTLMQVGGFHAFTDGKPGESSPVDKLVQTGKASADSVGHIKSILNQIKPIDQFRQDRDEAQRQIKTADDVDEAQRKADAKNASDQKAASVMRQFVAAPAVQFTPETRGLSASDLKQELTKQGVAIPDNFEDLYAVGHYDRPLVGGYAQRVWSKGAPYEMDNQTAGTFVLKYINPEFRQYEYDARKKDWDNLNNPDSKTGQTILNAGTAAQHLEMLRKASDALGSNDIQSLNRIANSFNTEIGKSAALTYSAIADKAADEVSKVAAGNAPYKEQVLSTRSTLTPANSKEQTDAVIRAFTDLMYGRINSIDEDTFSKQGKHLPNVSPEVTQLFQHYGRETPWATQAQTKQTPPKYDPADLAKLPMGNNQTIDAKTAQLYLNMAKNDAAEARRLATLHHWVVPQQASQQQQQ